MRGKKAVYEDKAIIHNSIEKVCFFFFKKCFIYKLKASEIIIQIIRP